MEPQEKFLSRADLAKAATDPMAEAFRRACALSQSKIDVELMIAVFTSLGESKTSERPKPKKKNGLNRPRNGVPSDPDKVSEDTVVSEYIKRMATRENRAASTSKRASLADYVRQGIDLTPEWQEAEMRQREARRALRRGPPRENMSWRESWNYWVERDRIVDLGSLGRWPAFVLYGMCIFIIFAWIPTWKMLSDWLNDVITQYWGQESEDP